MPASRSRRIAVLVVAGVVAVTCIALGLWQLRRLEERRSLNDRILGARSGAVELITTASVRATPIPYRRVRAAGSYDAGREVLIFGRSLGGEPGHHVVTPLILDDGSSVLVERGWVPFRMQVAPVVEAAPAADRVVVEGFLVPDEGDGSATPDARGVVPLLDVEGIATTLPSPVFPLALRLQEQSPAQPGLPTPIPLPALSEGPHLSYAIQWFSFAAVALIGAAILIGRDRRAVSR